jgi:hypothetical protein
VLAVAAVVVALAVVDAITVALALGGAGALALVAAATAVWQARRAGEQARRSRAERLQAEVQQVLGGVVDEALVAPTRAVHGDHRAVRRAATGRSAGHLAAPGPVPAAPDTSA